MLNLDPSIMLKISAACTLYTVICLLAEDLRDLEPVVTRTYDILTNPTIPTIPKQTLIRQILNDAISKWVSIVDLFNKIVDGKETLKTKMDRLWDLLKKLPNGHLTVYQILIIWGYFVYNILAINEGWFFVWYVDAIVISGIAVIMVILSSQMIGIIKFLMAVFKCLVPNTEAEIQAQLDLLQMFIIEGVHVYYELDLTKCNNNNVIKIAPSGSTFTEEQIHKNNLKDLSKTVETQINVLTTEKAKINGEIKAMNSVKNI